MKTVLGWFGLCVLWALVGAAPAHAEDTLLPSTVIVDASGSDATDAKNQAMASAQRDAFEQILRKFSPDLAPDIIAKTPPDKLDTVVRGMEVIEEKISGNRYRATLQVNFSGDKIQQLIEDASKPPPSAASGGTGGVLVLPVYDTGSAPLLWENKNTWRTAWGRAAIELGKGQVIVPFGDGTDSAVIHGANVAGAGYEALIPLMQRYGTGDIVVVTASFGGDAQPLLTVNRRIIGKSNSEIGVFTYNADDGESKDELLKRAARDQAAQLATRRTADRDMAALASNPGNQQMMVASISTLAAWSQIRTTLSALPMVQRMDILAMAPRQVDVMVHYQGDAQALADLMKVKGLRVAQHNQYWVIAKD